jgi:hypothetical protein
MNAVHLRRVARGRIVAEHYDTEALAHRRHATTRRAQETAGLWGRSILQKRSLLFFTRAFL